MSDTIINNLPWYITRAAAITAYILLFLQIVMGESMASGVAYKFITPPRAWLVHKYLGISFAVALLTHIGSLLFDNLLPFSLADVLIPFHTSYQPFFAAFGTVGMYLVLIVMVSSLVGRWQRSAWWRTLHFLVYPLFVLAIAHGFFIGTDSRSVFMLWLYGVTGAIFVLLLLHRGKLYFRRR